jgi:SAM-dependent methyltransferase
MTSASPDPTQRFSNRVHDYVRYRPGYPDALIQTLVSEASLSPTSIVADIGAGTGLSSECFLRYGCTVFALEPNAAMRAAAEERLGDQPRFRSIEATAEETTLASQSIDLITAGQAFHWFDRERSRQEFIRILKPKGWVALFWNSRRREATAFLRAYESLLLTYGTDYREVNHTQVDASVLEAFFGGSYQVRVFENEQVFDYEGLQGRLLSSSYAPAAGHPDHAPMLRELEHLFTNHQEDGRVRFLYHTHLYFGQLT